MLFKIIPLNVLASPSCNSDGSWCSDGLPGDEKIVVTNTGYIYPVDDGGMGNAGWAVDTTWGGGRNDFDV
eukprot:CAMPEP_0181303436 /NCGR_PEP_ID=MMETSP1101-20121128/8555_1 /TAXON_ID=46948 /ORGANISM="Rhodomonas abbreviata, Strain Caron Lab Isolate" /LENGTH=69 /DNA_ID=CAMNT_0023409005 /DNA_START=18 /DNA_END=227 /DNA_ORIENTATION=+